jgi:hypothetical protein
MFYYTKLEILSRDKHASLLRTFASYKENEVDSGFKNLFFHFYLGNVRGLS